MRRRLLNLATLVSLALTAATVAMRVRSDWANDQFEWTRPTPLTDVVKE